MVLCENEDGQGRKSIACEDLVHRVDQVVQNRRRYTLSEVSVDFSDIITLRGQRFCITEKLQDVMKTHLMTLAAILYEAGIGTLVHRYSECLNLHDDYVEKKL
ncbi:hypothetical protein AVEN_187557-1 [Araneus ventricosus]|uniref:Uncharacterized protein n=1 Tax=Araneus ventricosus TaxID=182803 RepID=A0A4Y2GRB9_ARAVE|nr:hypothetical protein AVEN_187557-1 [Araneus ventricosus]